MNASLSVRRRLAATMAVVAAGAVGVLLLSVPGAFGAYTARVTNASNTAGTNSYFTCTLASTALGASLAWPLDDAGTLGTGLLATARDVSGAGRTGSYSTFGVTYRQTATACPRDTVGGTAYNVVLNGSSGYVYYGTAFALDNSFTESIWFNTTTTRGGRLIGFGNATTGASNQYDRQVWMNNAGQLYFGVYPTTVKTVNSTASYNDGKWHQATATLGTTGMRLYVDGVLVGVDTTTTTAQTYDTNAMYLRVGYDNLDNWVSLPTSYYFAGSVRFADYFGATLSAAQVSTLYAAGTGA